MSFEGNETPFADKSVLSEDFVPDELIDREDEFQKINRILQQIVDREEPINAFIYGISGTGKTVSMKYKIKELQQSLQYYPDVHLNVLDQNCESLAGSYQVAIDLINTQLNNPKYDHLHEFLALDRPKLPQTGLPKAQVYRLFFKLLDACSYKYTTYRDQLGNAIAETPLDNVTADQLVYQDDPLAPEVDDSDIQVPPSMVDKTDLAARSPVAAIEKHLVTRFDIERPEEVRSYTIVVLDEVNNLGANDGLLYELSRASANDRVQRVDPSIIGITNDPTYKQNLRPKVESSLRLDEITFSKYMQTDLEAIIRQRLQLAFKKEAVAAYEDQIIGTAARCAIEEGSDARYAIALLYKAGRIIKEDNETELQPKHIAAAHKKL